MNILNTTEENLIKEFHRIKDKGWIKSISKSTGSIGITFENELNNWKTSQTKAKQKEFEKLDAIILGIIALSKKGEIIDVVGNLAKSKTSKANIAALKSKVMEFATSTKMLKLR